MSGSQILQKLKPGEKAKKFACALPHIGAGLVLTIQVSIIAATIAARLSEEVNNFLTDKVGFGSKEFFCFATATAALTAIAGIAYFALYLTKKTDKKLEQDNEQLQQNNQMLTDEKTKLKDSFQEYINVIAENAGNPETKLLDVFSVNDQEVSIKKI